MSGNKQGLEVFLGKVNDTHPKLKEISTQLADQSYNAMNTVLFKTYSEELEQIQLVAIDLNFPKISEYLGSIKKTCFYSFQSENEKAHKKVLRMMLECDLVLAEMQESLSNKELAKSFMKRLDIQKSKAHRLSLGEFYSLSRQERETA